METEQRIGFLGIGLAAVALVVTQTDLLPVNLSSLSPFGRANSERVSQTEQRGRMLMLEREFDVRPGGGLSVDVADADISIRSGLDSKASVRVFVSSEDREWGHDVFERMNFAVGFHGGEITVSAEHPRVDRSEWNDRRRSVGVQVEITVPSNYNAVICTADGDIDVSDMNGDVDLETSDGDISVGTLSGALYLRTSDGDVTAESLSGSSISVRTSDGDVRIRALSGPAEIATSDGDINISLDRAEELRLRTADGDITIYADESISANVDLSGEEVHMTSGFLLSNGRVTESGARGELNGGGPTLYAHTGDGAISIRGKGTDR